VYLGLPLSNVKLNLQAFAPLIAKVDRQLSGWKALLLNHAGRLVLINSVLDGMPAHLMSALLLPTGTIEALDKRRRAFRLLQLVRNALWLGTKFVSPNKTVGSV